MPRSSWFRYYAVRFWVAIALLLPISVERAAAADPPSPEAFELLENFHGHVCGGSLFGARLGAAAKAALLEAGGEGKLKAHYFDLSCPVDGIQVSAATTYGNAALAVTDRNEHRLILTAEGNQKKVEATLTAKASALALKSKELRKTARALAENSQERLVLEREIEEIFQWLRTAPSSEVVTVVQGTGG